MVEVQAAAGLDLVIGGYRLCGTLITADVRGLAKHISPSDRMAPSLSTAIY